MHRDPALLATPVGIFKFDRKERIETAGLAAISSKQTKRWMWRARGTNGFHKGLRAGHAR
jgi:hypothetical protein